LEGGVEASFPASLCRLASLHVRDPALTCFHE
jgi:hypothetical protein